MRFLRSARLAVLGLAAGLAACAPQVPRGAEAAYQAAARPRPVRLASAPQPAPTPSAQDFVTQAGAANAFEIAAAQTAAQRAQDPEVKAFAAVMLHDHAVAATDLRTALSEAGERLAPPAGPTPDQQAELAALSRLDPQAFDRTYLDGQLKAHRAALARLQDYAQNGQVVALAAFAADGASMTQNHLQLARRLDERLR